MKVGWKTLTVHAHLAAFFVLFIASCTTLRPSRSLEEVKASLDCVDGSDELQWEQVEKRIGEPDLAPRPAPGSLFRNTRVYKEKIVVFYVDTKETIEAGRSKFVEVVKTIEVCKEK